LQRQQSRQVFSSRRRRLRKPIRYKSRITIAFMPANSPAAEAVVVAEETAVAVAVAAVAAAVVAAAVDLAAVAVERVQRRAAAAVAVDLVAVVVAVDLAAAAVPEADRMPQILEAVAVVAAVAPIVQAVGAPIVPAVAEDRTSVRRVVVAARERVRVALAVVAQALETADRGRRTGTGRRAIGIALRTGVRSARRGAGVGASIRGLRAGSPGAGPTG
jgi:hypothetical protein